LKKIALFTTSLLISLILAIVGLELYFKNTNRFISATQFDSSLGWTTIPNYNFEEKGIRYTTNSLGFRSNEVDPSKDHVLVMGDSVVWGPEAQNNETVSSYLAEYFSEDQVLNLGVSGYGVDQYYLKLKQYISKLNPKLVVVIIFTGNDWDDSTHDSRYGRSKPFFTVDGQISFNQERKFTIDQNRLVLTNSPISRYSCSNIFSFSYTLSLPLFKSFRASFCKEKTLNINEAHYVLLGLLIKIGELVSEKKAGLLFVLSPSKSDFKYDFKKDDLEKEVTKSKPKPKIFNKGSQILFQNLFKQTRFPYLDFYEVVKEHGWKLDDLYLPKDNDHLSPLGLKFMAEAINNHLFSAQTKK
jgi:lysophospholipase L1-like esterase